MLLAAILRAHPGHETLLVEHEDAVLQLIPPHGGRVIERIRADESGDRPYEVQLIKLSEDALADNLIDPARLALADKHALAKVRTEVMRRDSLV